MKQDVLKLHLLKEKGRGLGIQISGGTDLSRNDKKGIYISHLLDGSVAERDGRLQIGDELLFINGNSLIAVSHKEAIHLLQSAPNPIQLVISRNVSQDHVSSAEKKQMYLDVLENNNNLSYVEKRREKSPVSHTKEIILINGRDGKKLGFSMTGGAENNASLQVKNILPDGIAAEDGRLKIGDELLKVNDIPLKKFKYQEAVALFRSLKKGPIKLLVRTQRKRRSSDSSNCPSLSRQLKLNDVSEIHVDLCKAPGRGLGIGFGQSSKSGIFVKYIAKGSIAACDGSLQLRDRIISLNGIVMKDTSLEDFHKILHNLQPGNVRFSVSRKPSRSRTSTMTTENSQSVSESERTRSSSASSGKFVGSNNLATLMSPAIPVNKRYESHKRNHYRQTAISLNDDSDDDFNDDDISIASFQRSTRMDNRLGGSLSKDGWLQQQQDQTLGSKPESGNPDDIVMNVSIKQHSPNMNSRSRADSGEISVSEKSRKVIIERDKSGSLGLSIKMKKNSIKPGQHNGVFAKNIALNGSADKGGVKSGEQILQVNNTKMDSLTYDGVIAFFKKIPKKSSFILKSSVPSQLIRKMSNTVKSTLDVPNLVEDLNAASPATIKRKSILEASFRQRESNIHRAATFKIIGKVGGIGVPLPESEDVPVGFDVHLLEVPKEDDESLGISLVPATGALEGYFQVRQVLLNSVCHESVSCGDCIYSVNGITFKHINHEQALQILKQSGELAKIVIIRKRSNHHYDDDDDNLTSHRTRGRQKSVRKMTQHSKPKDILPGTIDSEIKSHMIRPVMHRRTTESTIASQEARSPKSSPVAVRKMQKVKRNSLMPSVRSDDESSTCSNQNTPSSLPKVYKVNQRTDMGAFLIKKEKMFKAVGIEVMVDGSGQCHVTEISPHGMFADDERIRIGDNLLAINNEIVGGKPISLVRNIIRSVPRGEVQLIIRATNEVTTSQYQSNYPESVATTATDQQGEYESTTATSLFSLPLPKDTKSKVPTQRQSSLRMSVKIPAPSNFQNDVRENLRHDEYDAYSDVVSLPPAPPPPVLPAGFEDEQSNHVNYEEDNDSDAESNFSAMPAPPPPVTSFQIPSSPKSTRSAHLRDIDVVSSARSDFDDGKSEFTIMPPPPPPVAKNDIENYTSNSDTEEDNDGYEIIHGEELLSPPDEQIPPNMDALEYKKHMSMKLTQKFIEQNDVTDVPNIQSPQNGGTEIYYPQNSPYHQLGKKRSLLSRLKSKLLLPSKSELNETKPQKKSKNKQRPLSAVDFQDTTSRNRLKASISQPDLVVAGQTFDQQDGELRKFESLDESSFPLAASPCKSASKLDSQGSCASSLTVKQLPRILSFRKSKPDTIDKKKKTRHSRHSSNISPPNTPPPPPPADSRSDVFEQFSPYDIIPSPTSDDDQAESPYEEIDRFKFLGSQSTALSEASSASQGRSSYAIEGPSTREECSFEDALKNLKENNDLSHVKDKPPAPPPRPRSLNPSPQVTRREEIGIIEADFQTQDKPGLKKRGSSLLALNFPPPPSGRFEDEKSSPIATSSVENSPDVSLNDIPGFDTPPHFSRLDEISHKDKHDPKLQPFIITENLRKQFSPRDAVYDNYDDDEGSDWGSDFSSSVVDYDTQKQAASRYATQNRVNMFNVSTKERSLSIEGAIEATPPKRKQFDTKKGLFNKQRIPNQEDLQAVEIRPPTKNKEGRKNVKSLPVNLVHGKEVKISEPILVKRQTFTDVFSPKEQNVLGANVASNPSLDAIVNHTIRRNLGDPACVDSKTRKEPTSGMKNPIPKPPRKGQPRYGGSSGESYENLASQEKGETNGNSSSGPSYENIEKYQQLEWSSSIIGRPVPPIPTDDEEAFLLNNSTLSESELSQLYATVDLAKKKSDRLKRESLLPEKENVHREDNKEEKPYSSPEAPTRTSGSKGFREGLFQVQLVRETGKILGIVITGGNDTHLKKVLVKEVIPNSSASSCAIPLQPGDELLKVNEKDVTGFTHHQVLETLKTSPPLVNLTLHRKVDGNIALLDQQTEYRSATSVKGLTTKFDTQSFLATFKGSAQHSRESEVISINESHKRSYSESSKPNLTVDSFETMVDSDEKINMLMKTPPLLSKHREKTSMMKSSPMKTRARTISTSSMNTNVQVSSPMKALPPVKKEPTDNEHEVTWLRVDLHKQEGKGLGIAVTGGPKHIINEGIKVKRLVPDSIAALDGTLRKDDLICTINGRNLKGMTQGDALNFLKDIPKIINLGVKRGGSSPSNSDRPDSITPAQTPTLSSPVRQSRSREKKSPPSRRSRSETREEKPPSKQKRPSSVSRLSRLFRGSSDSINTLGKDINGNSFQETPTRKKSGRRKKSNVSLLTIFFDKTERDAFDFTITGGVNTMYGDSPILIESVRKGSELSKTLRANDALVSIQGVDVSRFSINRAMEFLSTLPLGRVCMVIQRR